MRHLPERVRPGIGAPGAVDPQRLLGNLRQRRLEAVLDRVGVRLRLPAAEPATVGSWSSGG